MKIRITVLALAAATLAGLVVLQVVADELFDIRCSQYLRQAATAGSVPTAERSLDRAIAYLYRTGRTAGYTSVLYRSPADDVGFWYGNLVDSYITLVGLDLAMRDRPSPADQLTASNTLLKLHNSLVAPDKDGDHLILPSGISVYPHNRAINWGAATCLVVIVLAAASLWLQRAKRRTTS